MKSHDMQTDQLRQALKFSDKDLDANRDGILTRAQHNNVLRLQHIWAEFISAMTLLGVGIFIVADAPRGRIIEFWGVVIFLIAVGLFLFKQRTLWLLNRAKIAKTHGIAHLQYKLDKKYPEYHIVMPDKRFPLTRHAYSIFVEGEIYTLYYLPDLNHLLSAEHHEAEPLEPVM